MNYVYLADFQKLIQTEYVLYPVFIPVQWGARKSAGTCPALRPALLRATGALQALFGPYGVGVRFAEPTKHKLNTKRLSSDVGGLRKGKSCHGTDEVYINFDLMLLT